MRPVQLTAAGENLQPFLAIKGDAVQKVVWRQLSIAIMIMATNTCVWAQDLEKGRIEFLSKCAECHGADGKGAGRISNKLKIKPADLTLLAKKNNGVFSPNTIAELIDGRSATSAHLSPEMPIWGCRQGPPPGGQGKAYKPKSIDSLLDLPCDPEEVIQKQIQDIVAYLAQIQEK